MRLLTVVCVLLGGLWLSGCSTVESRIRDQEAFSQWPVEVQNDLRQGIVRLGYTPPMAYVAYGAPDQRIRSEQTEKTTLVWVYQAQYPVYDSSPYHGWFELGWGHHGGRYGHHHYYEPSYVYETRDYLRLHFEAGARGGLSLVKIERIE